MILMTLIGCVSLINASFAQDTPEERLPSVFEGVGIDEQLGESIPLDLVFLNEKGEEVTLDMYFDGERPVLLNFVYHNCPMLCSILLEGFTKTLGELEWTPGQEFDILTVSFSSLESPELASTQKQRYLKDLGRPEASSGWHFLTGSEDNIQALARSTGFQFKWMESTRDFAHPAALIFLAGDGKITRYIHGMYFAPSDVRKAIVEASRGTVGTRVDQIFLYCYRYDANANSYVLHATNLMRMGGFLTVLVLLTGLFIFWRRERRRQTIVASPS